MLQGCEHRRVLPATCSSADHHPRPQEETNQGRNGTRPEPLEKRHFHVNTLHANGETLDHIHSMLAEKRGSSRKFASKTEGGM